MKCPVCKGDTRVMQSKDVRGGVARRRKCVAGHLSYSMERAVAENMLFKSRKKPKRKAVAAVVADAPPEPPKLQFSGIPVTKDSPDWLKRVAELVG